MTREEFKGLVRRTQRSERISGYIIFLFPFATAVFFLGQTIVDYFKDSQSTIYIQIAAVIVILFGIIALLGIRMINRKFKTFILIRFDTTKVTADELTNAIMERLNYQRAKSESALLTLKPNGWQTSHQIYIGSDGREMFADLRLTDNDGFFNWATGKLKKRFVNEIVLIGKEKQCEIIVEMEAQ